MKSIAAGLFNVKVYFYSLENSSTGDKLKLTYHTQITTKQKGKKQGKKVTGLTFLRNLSDGKVAYSGNPGNSPKNGGKRKGRIQAVVKSLRSPSKKKKVKDQLLITTNDSRLRLVGMKDFCMVRKYKGHANKDNEHDDGHSVASSAQSSLFAARDDSNLAACFEAIDFIPLVQCPYNTLGQIDKGTLETLQILVYRSRHISVSLVNLLLADRN